MAAVLLCYAPACLQLVQTNRSACLESRPASPFSGGCAAVESWIPEPEKIGAATLGARIGSNAGYIPEHGFAPGGALTEVFNP